MCGDRARFRCVFRSAQSLRPFLTALILSVIGLICWWLICVSQNLVLLFDMAHFHCLVETIWHLCYCHLVMQCPLLVPGHKISEATSLEVSRISYRHIQIGLSATCGQVARIPVLFWVQNFKEIIFSSCLCHFMWFCVIFVFVSWTWQYQVQFSILH